ncbi:MAG: hypothetical protein ABSG99_02680 [Sedimentisphaerales bacterium]
MPLALEPNETFEIILDGDKDKSRETQPRFIYQYLTCRQWRKIAQFNDQLEGIKDAEQVMDKIFETATTKLVGWVNIVDPQSGPILFDIKKFEDVVTMHEAMELIAKILKQGRDFSDKKKLDSHQDLGMAASVSIPEGNAKSRTNANTETKKQ